MGDIAGLKHSLEATPSMNNLLKTEDLSDLSPERKEKLLHSLLKDGEESETSQEAKQRKKMLRRKGKAAQSPGKHWQYDKIVRH